MPATKKTVPRKSASAKVARTAVRSKPKLRARATPATVNAALETRHLLDSLGTVNELMTHPGLRPHLGMLRATSHALLSRLAAMGGVNADLIATPELSGAQWVARFPGSKSTDTLAPPFRTGVENFIAAMETASAVVTISATLRPPERAYLMHWSWMIAREGADPKDATPMAGVDILWDHGNDDASKQAAEDMVQGYAIVKEPALSSRHTQGLAIDMTISWNGDLVITDQTGASTTIDSTPRSGMNSDLIAVGATYGVIKATFAGDPPHWSNDGH